MFTGDYLRSFHETLEERCICCLEDPLGTRIYLFRLEGKTVLLHPFGIPCEIETPFKHL